MRNTQKSIDSVCEYRVLPPVKKGQPCTVNGEKGLIVGGNSSCNFNVRFASGNISNCHPYWKMKILTMDRSETLYEHDS